MDLPTDPIVADYLALVDDSQVAILPHALRVAVELGVAEAVDFDVPAPVATTADRIGVAAGPLCRLLRTLGSAGFFAEDAEGAFTLTGLGGRLRRDAPDSLYASLLNTESQLAWLHAADSFRTGRASFDRGSGGDFFGAKDLDADANTAFLRRMRERTGRLYRQAAHAIDWTGAEVIMDIGGADGFLLTEILAVAPHASGVLFDRPQTIAGVRPPARCRAESGDFFVEVPRGADTHLLCSVLHDWTDEQVVSILRNSHKALRPVGRLLVVEMLVPRGTRGHSSRWSDLGMMVLTGGQERTLEEFTDLLGDAGYRVDGVHSVPGSPFSVIEAR